MEKVYYIVNYPCAKKGHIRIANRAAALQSEYLAQVVAELGYRVELVSTSVSDNRKRGLVVNRGFVAKYKQNIRIRYFTCIDSKYWIFRVFGRILYRANMYVYLKKQNGIFIIYHSTIHYPIYHWLINQKKKFILEVEEVFADVTQDKAARKREIEETKKAAAYIIPNRIMVPEITQGKHWVLYHGTCKKEPRMKPLFQDGRIHVVYAGTLDPRKIGDLPSLDAAKYLDNKYQIHVLGVGYPDNLKKIKYRVGKMHKPHCEITFHDPLDGGKYLQFLQSCDIGLYTQNSCDIDINTSFPSKLMSYLSNGLRIVAARTAPLELSELSDVIYFADSNSGVDIAGAIKSIDFSDGYDGRKKAAAIHKRLKKDLRELLRKG